MSVAPLFLDNRQRRGQNAQHLEAKPRNDGQGYKRHDRHECRHDKRSDYGGFEEHGVALGGFGGGLAGHDRGNARADRAAEVPHLAPESFAGLSLGAALSAISPNSSPMLIQRGDFLRRQLAMPDMPKLLKFLSRDAGRLIERGSAEPFAPMDASGAATRQQSDSSVLGAGSVGAESALLHANQLVSAAPELTPQLLLPVEHGRRDADFDQAVSALRDVQIAVHESLRLCVDFASGGGQEDRRVLQLDPRRDAPSDPVEDALRSAVFVEPQKLSHLGRAAQALDQGGVAMNGFCGVHGTPLHTMFSKSANAAFNNNLFSSGRITAMHASMKRLYRAANESTKKELGPSELASLMNESPQVITNWARRGLSRSGAIKAEGLFGASAAYLLDGGIGALREISQRHENVDTQAQSPSQSPREDTHTGSAVGVGQQTIS